MAIFVFCSILLGTGFHHLVVTGTLVDWVYWQLRTGAQVPQRHRVVDPLRDTRNLRRLIDARVAGSVTLTFAGIFGGA